MVIARYAASRRGPMVFLATAVPVGGLVVGLLVFLEAGVAGGAVSLVSFVGVSAFYAYYFGFRHVYLVELTPVELRWRHALRGGVAPLGDVRSVRRSEVLGRRGTVEVATVEFTSRAPLKFPASAPGLAEFLASLHATAPQVAIEPPGL